MGDLEPISCKGYVTAFVMKCFEDCKSHKDEGSGWWDLGVETTEILSTVVVLMLHSDTFCDLTAY